MTFYLDKFNYFFRLQIERNQNFFLSFSNIIKFITYTVKCIGSRNNMPICVTSSTSPELSAPPLL